MSKIQDKELSIRHILSCWEEVIASISAAQSGAGAVTSASVGSVSVSYGGVSTLDLSPKGQARELYDAARRYLDIYRG